MILLFSYNIYLVLGFEHLKIKLLLIFVYHMKPHFTVLLLWCTLPIRTNNRYIHRSYK